MSVSGESNTVVGGAFDSGWEHVTQEEVIVRMNHYLVLVLPEVLDRISRPRVALETRHYELFGEVVRGDIL